MAVTALSSCTGQGEAQKPQKLDEPVNVKVLRIETTKIEDTYRVSGIIQGIEEAQVTAAISGEISTLILKEGDNVKKGEVVARIDPADYMLALEKAEVILDGNKKNFERIDELYRKKAISKAEYDNAETELKLAQTSLAEARLNLSRTKITSPITGEVVRKDAILGGRVVPGTPLYRIVDAGKLKLIVAISEREMVYLKTNDEVEIDVGAYPGEVFTGKIRSLRFSDKPGVASFPVEIVIDGRGRLKPGMVGRAVLHGEVLSDLLLVPSEAVVERLGLYYLFMYEDGHARLRQIEIGRRFGEFSEITKGISPGEYIIPFRHASLTDETPVNVVEEREKKGG